MAAKRLTSLLAVASGVVTVLWLHAVGITESLLRLGVGLFDWLYLYAGVVSYGLAPLAGAQAALVVWQLGHHVGWWQMHARHLRWHELTESTAPMLGILGTMIGLASALEELTAKEGVQHAIQNMSIGVSQALGSSVIGLILALIAYVARHMYGSSATRREP